MKLRRGRPIAIVPDHGGKHMPNGTLRGILKQAGITIEEFRALLKQSEGDGHHGPIHRTSDTRHRKRGFTVSVPALPGCVTDGENVDDALTRASEEISLYLQDEDEESLAAATNRAEVNIVSVEVAGAA